MCSVAGQRGIQCKNIIYYIGGKTGDLRLDCILAVDFTINSTSFVSNYPIRISNFGIILAGTRIYTFGGYKASDGSCDDSNTIRYSNDLRITTCNNTPTVGPTENPSKYQTKDTTDVPTPNPTPNPTSLAANQTTLIVLGVWLMLLCIFCAGVVIFVFGSRQRLKIQSTNIGKRKSAI